MKTVKLYGILKEKFGSSINIKVGRMSDVVHSIDSIRNNFRKTLLSLLKDNQSYYLIEEKESNTIHLLPAISGFGGVFYQIAGYLLLIIGYILVYTGVFAWLGAFLVLAGSALIGYGSYISAIEKIPKPQQQYISVGGQTNAAEVIARSYTFSNESNLAAQGSMIQIGYGTSLVGSSLINIALQNYNINLKFSDFNQPANQFKIND